MRMRLLLSLILFLGASSQLVAQEERAYTEGTVSVVSSIKLETGQFDNFMNYLSKTWKPVMEAQKKAGNVVDYSVYGTRARSPNDPDMYLVVTYANMAAFDGMADRMEPVTKAVTGMTREQATAAGVERRKMREVLGTELIRELKLK